MSAGAAIFDLDGTLVDSAILCVDILNSMLRERGSRRSVTVECAKPLMSGGGAHLVGSLLASDCGDLASELIEFRRRYSEIPTPTASLFDGVLPGLEQLRDDGVRLAICSNKPQRLCEKVVRELGLQGLFSQVVGSTPERKHKPEPDMLEYALDLLDARPQDCVYVGDSRVDHETARSAGVPFLLVDYGYADAGWDRTGLASYGDFAGVVTAIGQLRRSRRAQRRAA